MIIRQSLKLLEHLTLIEELIQRIESLSGDAYKSSEKENFAGINKKAVAQASGSI